VTIKNHREPAHELPERADWTVLFQLKLKPPTATVAQPRPATPSLGTAQHWHFQRRDGAIADKLIAVADELRRQHRLGAAVVLIVGRSEHGYHHVLGSVPRALERHVHYPVIVIP
jgi:nucleotide-binding universal stress UspA family protein